MNITITTHFFFGSEYLVQNKYAAPGKVAINGASNGGAFVTLLSRALISLSSCLGLLVAACINRAPEGTFGAAVAEVGVHDLLRVRTSLTLSTDCLDCRVVPQIYDRFVVCNLIYGFILELTEVHNTFTGKAWKSDYGNPDHPHDFDYILPISPLHNVPSNKILPPTLLLTSDRTPFSVHMTPF
jgi:prolyl oligopeptidase